MADDTNTAGGTAAALSISGLKEMYGGVKLRESTIKDLKTGIKDLQDCCSAAQTTLLKYLENSYGNGAILSAEQFLTISMRTRDLYLQKKVADDDLKDLLNQIEEEKTKRTQSMLKLSLGESVLKKAAVVCVSRLDEVDYFWQRKLKLRRIELVRGNDPGEVVAIRQFCGSHFLEIRDAEQLSSERD